MSRSIDISLQPKNKQIEIFPYGVTMGPEASRPVLIFKDKLGQHVLPVWLSPLDAGIAVTQNSVQNTSSPHNLTMKILEALDVDLQKCVFTKIHGHHQFVKLHFKGSDKIKKLESRADEAMSFCLSAKTRYFCTVDFIEECRDLDLELIHLTEELMVHPERDRNPHPYLN